MQHKLHREGSDEYTWSIREEEPPTEWVGSFTSWVRLNLEQSQAGLERARGLFLCPGRRLTLKSWRASYSSSPANISSEVPQGSILAPLLFGLSINKLLLSQDSKLLLSAGDILLYSPVRQPSDFTTIQCCGFNLSVHLPVWSKQDYGVDRMKVL